jgi:1-acyl-sn-glycerol-3-phosphate acyltransferase
MVSNHGTFFDPWIVGHYSKYPISIMNNEDAFNAPWVIRWYLKNIGTFPKKKGASDYKAMKTTINRLKLGYPVLIFPEGQTTWDGATQVVFSGIEKIIKKSNVPLVMTNVKGNFLSKPWWSNSYRKGTVRVNRKVLLTKQIQLLSEEEILEAIITHIKNNDILDEQNLNTEFKGEQLASGLERFVWICRSCRTEDTLVTEGDVITCSQCHSSWTMDSHCRFTPAKKDTVPISNLYDWALWHKEQVIEKVREANDDGGILTRNRKVIYCRILFDGKLETITEGDLSLSKENLTFNSENKEKSFILPVKDISDYVYQRKDVFECRCNEHSYRFRLIGQSPMKWVYYLRYLKGYEKIEERGYL